MDSFVLESDIECAVVNSWLFCDSRMNHKCNCAKKNLHETGHGQGHENTHQRPMEELGGQEKAPGPCGIAVRGPQQHYS